MTDSKAFKPGPDTRFLMFTGHRLDTEDRKTPRFPASIEAEVSRSLSDEIKKVKETSQKEIFGVAGGASGGDIIFHEQCRKLGIKTGLFLALPPDEYKQRSVSDSGENWIKRFDALYNSLPVFYLPNDFKSSEYQKENLSIWQKNNLWQLDFCLQNGSENILMLALWDGKKGDGPGGTGDMVEKVKEAGGEVILINPTEFF